MYLRIYILIKIYNNILYKNYNITILLIHYHNDMLINCLIIFIKIICKIKNYFLLIQAVLRYYQNFLELHEKL